MNMIETTKLVINSKGIFVNGEHVSKVITDKIKGLWSHAPSEEEIEEIGPGNKLVIGDHAIVNLPEGVPVNITISGNVYGKINISSCNNFTIKGDMKGNVEVSSGDVKVSGDVSGNISSGSCKIEVTGDVGGDINVTSGTVKIGGRE